MDPVRNPYSPGAGRAPGSTTSDATANSSAGGLPSIALRPARPRNRWCIYGLRGVGKTNHAHSRSSAPPPSETGSSHRLRLAPGSRCAKRSGEALHAPLAETWPDHQRASGY